MNNAQSASAWARLYVMYQPGDDVPIDPQHLLGLCRRDAAAGCQEACEILQDLAANPLAGRDSSPAANLQTVRV